MSAGENFFMTEEWLHDKRLSWSNRALLSKLYALTQQGTIEKQVTNQFFFEMGFTEKEMRNSWKVLQACGYISKRIDKIEGNKCYVSFLQAGSCPKGDTLPTKGRYPIAQRASHHTVSNTNSNTNSNTLVDIVRVQNEKACPDQSESICSNEIPLKNGTKCPESGTKYPKKRDKISEEAGRNVETLPTKELEQKTESKKKEKIVYPASVEEVEILFNEHIQKWASEKPELKNINVKYESSLFLDYWQSADWKRKGKAVKSVKGAVATWIANASRNFGYRPRQTQKTAQEIEQFAQDVQELVDQQYNAFNSNNNNNNISDAEVVDIKDVSEIENLFLETKTK